MKTAEWVTPKHPDKLCDQISDAILDFCLTQDKNSRVAVETMGGHGKISIMGEVTFDGILENKDIYKIVKRITGYSKAKVSINIVKQSPEIANGVDTGGAGDQGIMIGYACNKNPEMMPQDYYLARSLGKFIYKEFSFDGKTQITLDDFGNIKSIVASFQNVDHIDLSQKVGVWLEENNYNDVGNIRNYPVIYCNPAGDWSQGGFDADTGLTGRKLMVDNYGPSVSIGGGAFSGKDATKVDRSGAYMAHKAARDLLKKYEAKEVIVKLAYSIGVADPVMATAIIKNEVSDIREVDISKEYDLTPKGIIKFLKLKEPQFEKTAQFGHFGNDFTWDK